MGGNKASKLVDKVEKMNLNGGGAGMEDQPDGCFPSKPAVPDQMECYQQQEVAFPSSQPATQPLDGSFEMDDSQSQNPMEGVWGQLYPHCGTFPRLPLRTDAFRLGRAKSCDYVIRQSDMGSEKWWTAISKCQCEIIKDKGGVFLRDKSSNGTWVNGYKVGKDKMYPLEHNAEISFAGANKKVYVFMSSEPSSDVFPSELTSKYTVSKVLGKGACGEVRLGFRIPDLHRVAIKIVCKKTTTTTFNGGVNSTSVLNEVRILQSVSHPCIINLEDVIDTPNFLFIVLELAEGGELFDKIIEKTKLNENEAKLHFFQIASAISYLHSKKICHRDLKPENVLLCTTDETQPIVKITDMGLSKLVHLETRLKTFCGTPQYIAPEVVSSAGLPDSSYNVKVDCWSLGVILYILLSGTPPFSEDRTCGLNLRAQILQANFQFYPSLFDSISAPAKDLIRKLLRTNPEERLSAEEILRHPWLQDPAMIKKADCLMDTQRKSKKRVLGEEEAGGGEKRARVGEVVASKAGDSRPSSDAPDCSVSVFKLPATGVQAVK